MALHVDDPTLETGETTPLEGTQPIRERLNYQRFNTYVKNSGPNRLEVYNTQRRHQGSPGRIAPQQSWDATAKTDPPRPIPQRALIAAIDGRRMTHVRDNGTDFARGIRFQVSRNLFGALVCLVEEDDRLLVLDTDGTVIIEHP